MDHELRFIASLLHSPTNDQREFYLRQIPKGVFKIREDEIRWVYEFRQRYGRYPSPQAFFHKFNAKLKIPRDPLLATLQPILDRAMYDQMVRVQERTQKLLDEGASVVDAMSAWKADAAKVTEFSLDYSDIHLGEYSGAQSHYRERIQAKKQGEYPLTSPWPSFNKLIKFFLPKEVYTIAARSSMGKTWMALRKGHHFASRGVRTLLVSKEMSKETLNDRIECIRYQLPYEQFREGELPPATLRRWRKEVAQHKKDGYVYPFVISGTESREGVGFAQILAAIDKHTPEVVIVDGAYLIWPEGLGRGANDVQRFTHVSNRSKDLAKATNTFWINVVQQGRRAEDKEGSTKGGATTIHGADAWYQDSDWVHDISGKRGTFFRTHTLLKGRESGIGGFASNFKLDPPDFSEITGLIAQSSNEDEDTVGFKGLV